MSSELQTDTFSNPLWCVCIEEELVLAPAGNGESKAFKRRGRRERPRGVRGEYFGGMRVAKTWGLMFAFVVLLAGLTAWGQSQPGLLPPQAPSQDSAQNSGATPGKELPDAPEERKEKEESKKKEQSANPARQASEMTRHAATSGLIRARNWESTWVTGVYVARDQPLIDLTTRQRETIYLRQTLTTPGAYLKRAFGAGMEQGAGPPRGWDDGWGGYAERVACRAGPFIAAQTPARR